MDGGVGRRMEGGGWMEEGGGFVSRPAGRGGGVCGGKMPKIPTPRLW